MAKILSFLTEVGLKDDIAETVAKHMEEEFEIETVDDLKHLSKEDMDGIIEKTGIKKVSAGKILGAWEGLKNGGAVVPAQGKKRGFLPGYSDAAAGGDAARRGLRLMYLSEEGTEGKRELLVDHEKTSGLFDAMKGDALLVTVFGPARCGKSFLMNLLSGHRDLFEVAHGNLPCTQGVFISELFEDGATFRQRAATMAAGAAAARTDGDDDDEDGGGGSPPPPVAMTGKSYASSATVSYVDVEGLGDKGKAYDVHLIAPLLLVSKVLMYNWKGAPNKHVMLESLLTLGEAAQRVHVGDSKQVGGGGGDDGGGGGSSSKPKPIFGHLVVMLRDWHSTENVFTLLFDPEPEPARGDDAVKARNRARELVVNAFESITIKCLPYPGVDPGDSSMGQLSSEFVDEYLQLQEHLVQLTQSPEPTKMFNDRPLDGPTISTLLPLLADKLNSDEDLLPKEVWRLMEEHRLSKLLEDNRLEVKQWLETTADEGLPTTPQRCDVLAQSLRDFGLTQMGFLDDLSWLSAETMAATKATYGSYMEEQVTLLVAKNETLRGELLDKAKAAVADYSGVRLKDELDREVCPLLPNLDSSSLEADLEARQARALSALEADIGDLAAQVLEVLEKSVAELFSAAALTVVGTVRSNNQAMVGRAEAVRLKAAAALTASLQSLRRRSEETPLPEAEVLVAVTASEAALESDVVGGLGFVVEEYKGRVGFVGEQSGEAKAAAATEVDEVKKAWPKHCVAHLDAAAAVAFSGLKDAIAAKEPELPAKSGELEIWADAQVKTVGAGLDPVAAALGLSGTTTTTTTGAGSAAPPSPASLEVFTEKKKALMERGDTEVKALRNRNNELIRKIAPPDASNFGKLLGGDETVTCVVVVPQPNTKFAVPVDAIQIERKPSAREVPLEMAVGKGEAAVEIIEADLANGKQYTFRTRAKNGNGWGAWSKPSTAQPFGRPGPPAVLAESSGGIVPAPKAMTFLLDSKADNGGSPITGYRIIYKPTNPSALHGDLSGEVTVPLDDQQEDGKAGVVPVAAAEPTAARPSNGDAPRVTCPGLTDGVEYSFVLQAENKAGLGPACVKPVVATPAPTPPQPRVVRVTPMDGALQIVLEPSDASDPLADPLAGYVAPPTTTFAVVLRKMGTYSYGDVDTREFEAGAVNTYIVRQLENGAQYQISVKAKNAIGWSPPSGVIMASPRTPWAAMKRMLALCSGPKATTGAVLEQPPPEAGNRTSRSQSAAVDMSDIY